MMGGRKRWEKIRYGGILVEGTPLTVMMVIILEAFKYLDDDGDVEVWIKRRIKLENKVIENLSWNTGSFFVKTNKKIEFPSQRNFLVL